MQAAWSVVSGVEPGQLIYLSVDRSGAWQAFGMMSPEDCWLKVALCEARAELCSQPALKSAWLGLAVDWRDMAGDVDGTGTLARLMGRKRALV